jgi:small conductance mechanosensitive channel
MKELLNADMSEVASYFIKMGVQLGGKLLAALLIFVVGRLAIKLVNRLLNQLFEKRKIDLSVKIFLLSVINISLMVLLIISVVGTLGVSVTSFAALLASAGVAIGMALSGNLQNFAGGLVILMIKPYKVGDVIESQDVTGTVSEIQIFHTILKTFDNKVIYIPNGALSSGVVTNYTHQKTRRVDWILGVDYGEDFDKTKSVIERVLNSDNRILKDPEAFVALHEFAASSVNIVVRAWVKSPDYWDVYFGINKAIYAEFNKEGINFPFPQLTVHQAK